MVQLLRHAPLVALLSSAANISPAKSPSEYRAAAELCVDTFVRLTLGPLSRPMEVNKWEQTLVARCGGLEGGDGASNPLQNMLLVATDDSSDLVGCVECGLLPPPPRIQPKDAPAPAEDTPPPADVPYLANLVVAPAGRRQGLGQRLVAATEDCARGWGFDELCIKVDRANFEARRLYDRMGYKLVYMQPKRAEGGWTSQPSAWLYLRKEFSSAEPES